MIRDLSGESKEASPGASPVYLSRPGYNAQHGAGLIVDAERIDGARLQGRWDLHRKLK
jgi:hypothetical protein